MGEIRTLEADEAINPAGFGWSVCDLGQSWTQYLRAMRNADDTKYYYGAQNNTLAAIVLPTPTHTNEDNHYFTPIPGGAKFTDDDVLTITVKDDYVGLTGSQTGGTYKQKLSDVKLSETENLTALKSGEHYILTVTLKHNTLVSATATWPDGTR